MVHEIQVGDIRVLLGGTTPANRFDAVMVVLFCSEKLVLVKNKHRAWEFPGGRREGLETYEETARREAYDEAGATIEGVLYLGHYVASNDKVTVITCAEVTSLIWGRHDDEISRVDLFERLPPGLSFGDGREQLIFGHALVRRMKGDAF